ncbi:molybdopterin molybdotransferase MoeA [Cyclobacterium xiamenense]|uniref:molybdopterin molybdotransferase MoeA n=1 Tax=Cyclobacterium xiamenense TaxID=1297121 RepID=UPI0012BA3688|nr:molybdopterin molybdotransferase MoeA [Cyclobacterium xiamenense]
MISVHEAKEILSTNPLSLPDTSLPFQQSLHHTLAADVFADRDAPPFHRVTMDGIAIQAASLKTNKRYRIEGIQAAGQPQRSLSNSNHCLEVMTGAMLPKNTDCVIPYEKIRLLDGMAEVDSAQYSPYQNVHLQGTDAKKGDRILEKGNWIHAGKLSVLASLGHAQVSVRQLPRVLVCATGDELVPVEQPPLPHQIRSSNVYMLESALKDLGINAKTAHLADERQELKDGIEKALKEYQVLLFSGAVSKGKFDFLPEVFRELGVDTLIHGVKQKPGKPFLFGRKGDCFVFGFPGNPASTLVCFHTYFKTWLSNSLQRDTETPSAILAEEVVFNRPVTYHLLVKTTIREGKIWAVPIKNSGSGDWVHLSEADAFLSLPADATVFKKNEVFPITYFHKDNF